ncbi:hypothetical protein [Terribacillus saccharophilus]|uniref:hypothetical protein n=1 Tax=Terribacillus saccharophilus TaxID=361277 RepID=UPI002989E345|nr:hypothetical protein [Terribacillus saccharophilus]MCM3224340.1 hypothetical protein [Terribacillus saccharophilus]
MNRIHNEKGAALAIVLWIIVLFVVLGTILFAQLLSTTNQMNRQGESTAESDIANMSAIYVSAYLKQNGGSDGISSKELSSLIDDMPDLITIDQYDVELGPEVEEDQIILNLEISRDNEVLEKEVLVPLKK